MPSLWVKLKVVLEPPGVTLEGRGWPQPAARVDVEVTLVEVVEVVVTVDMVVGVGEVVVVVVVLVEVDEEIEALLGAETCLAPHTPPLLC